MGARWPDPGALIFLSYRTRRGAPLGNQNAKSDNPASAAVVIRLTPEEKQRWRDQAAAEGKTLSEWIKNRVERDPT